MCAMSNATLFITMSTPSILSSSSTSKNTNKFISSNTTQDDHAPLWACVTISDKAEDGGGNKSWTCNFCNKSFKSSYSRVKAHLLRIHKDGIGVCSKLVVDLAENKIKPKHVPLLTKEDNSSLKRRNMGPWRKDIKSKYYIANRMAEVIKEVEEENVVQVITDNDVACKGMIIEASFPKHSLQSMVISEEWDSYKEGDIEHTTKAQAAK
ncbi:hypothetical protein Lal_00042104 [Lupinus albus]|nr:hypothetical protein Lal_00042104 [Lupinus albus]